MAEGDGKPRSWATSEALDLQLPEYFVEVPCDGRAVCNMQVGAGVVHGHGRHDQMSQMLCVSNPFIISTEHLVSPAYALIVHGKAPPSTLFAGTSGSAQSRAWGTAGLKRSSNAKSGKLNRLGRRFYRIRMLPCNDDAPDVVNEMHRSP